jgi:hypothetical protein
MFSKVIEQAPSMTTFDAPITDEDPCHLTAPLSFE